MRTRSVPSDDPTRRLADILANIERIRRYTSGMTAARFAGDDKTRDAVERCLERIAEAARKLGPGFDEHYPEVGFPNLRRFGSVLRHDYDGVDPGQVWGALTGRLNALESACRKELGLKPAPHRRRRDSQV